MTSGTENICKECKKQYTRDLRAANPEHYKKYEKTRWDLPKREALRKAYRKRPNGRAAIKAKGERFKQQHPRKAAAWVIFKAAVRAGRLAKLPCAVCGARKTDGHHEDYDKPLAVVWLCRKHHHQRHREMRELGISP